MSDWYEAKIKDFADVKGGKRLPKGKQLVKEPNNHPYIRIRDLGKSKYLQLTSEYEYVDDETQQSISRYIVNKGDILISVVGTIGLIGIVGATLDGANQTENCDKIINITGVMPEYLYYYLKSNLGQDEIRKGTVGAVQPKLPLKNVQDISVFYPPMEEQERIVAILSAIDEKIETNEAVNNNLEQQAQAIFLKMFPDIFSTSASSSFQNLIEFSNGKKRPEAIGDIPVYGGNGILAYTNQSNAENCVIIGRVGAYCGNTFLCSEKCWTSDNAIQAKSKNEDSQLFIYYLLRNASLPSRHIGTGQPLMTQAILNAVPVNEPSTQEIRSFINVCTPLHEIIFANEKQNISLTLLRDTLLPKLMSGELDVSDIDL